MAVYFFDSSALVKRFVSEVGSGWVASVAHPSAGNAIRLASLTGAEVVSAIARRERAGALSATASAGLIAQFRAELGANYAFTDLTAGLLSRAMDLAEAHGLRGSDAVQMATALAVEAECAILGLGGGRRCRAERRRDH